MLMQRTAIRITDPHVIKLIEDEIKQTGEGTATKAAGRLIIERLTQRESVNRVDPKIQDEPASP